jgi:hypothetical protein
VIAGRRPTPAGPHRRLRRIGRARGLDREAARRLTPLASTLALLGGLLAGPQGRAGAREVAFLEFPMESVMPRRIGDDAARSVQPELELSMEFASAYVFRGYNVFQADHQREQKWVNRPQITWSPARTGVSLGYAAANQLTGDNLVSNVAAGLGAEHDLFAAYEFGRRQRLGLTAEIAVVAYPAADAKVVGTSAPVFVSVSVEPRYRHNLYLYVGYLRGFRSGPFEGDQVYLSPRVEKRFALGDRFGLELQLGAGLKILQLDLGGVRENMFDVLATTTLYYALNEVFYVGAKVGWAWTNFTSHRDPDTGLAVRPRFADEYVPFWALSVGAEFSTGGSVASPARAPRYAAQAM